MNRDLWLDVWRREFGGDDIAEISAAARFVCFLIKLRTRKRLTFSRNNSAVSKQFSLIADRAPARVSLFFYIYHVASNFFKSKLGKDLREQYRFEEISAWKEIESGNVNRRSCLRIYFPSANEHGEWCTFSI